MNARLTALLFFVGCHHSAKAPGPVDGGMPAALTISLPQAIDDALWANPEIFPTIPLHVKAPGATSVSVQLGSNTPVSAALDTDGETFTAPLVISALIDGPYALTITAQDASGVATTSAATLGVGREGVQLTAYAQNGHTRTPHLIMTSSLGRNAMFLAWADDPNGPHVPGPGRAWLQQLDGAGRFLTDRVPLGDPNADVLYLRPIAGTTTIGLLYQTRGSPYQNFFTICDFTGKSLMDPLALDPPNTVGSPNGADIDFDGSAYVVVVRSSGAGHERVSWARIDETSHTVTGPVAVAMAFQGDADPNNQIGRFELFTKTSVRVIGDQSLVGFVRNHWNADLLISLPESEFVMVAQDGTVGASLLAGGPDAFNWWSDARVFRTADQFVPLWGVKSLSTSEDNPPVMFQMHAFSAGSPPEAGTMAGTTAVTGPDDREDPFFLAHPSGLGLLFWEDFRSEVGGTFDGYIQLFAAPIDSNLKEGTELHFNHARFIAGAGEINAVLAGTNAIMMWTDYRHGAVVLDPKSEAYFETYWY